ncbi:MAG: hypothetical protein K2I75_03145 [Clostridiales bacterium]|nr:hypothetical protein [Clostridiales bacterium]
MKRKAIKILSIIWAFTLLLAVFALTACTDRKNPPPQPRKLDEFEKSIVGTWRDSDNWGYDFNSDGTYTTTNGHAGEFYHIETRAIGNRYCKIIKCVSDVESIRAIFDDEPDTMYGVYNDVVVINDNPCKRKTNNEEVDENHELLNSILRN